ncbi:MAG: translation initiation factor eIF-2B [Candidatus Pacearchaeota archaeon]
MSFKKFNKICNDIRKVKIQGAENIAKAVLEALKIKNDKNAIKKLISLRPTEPAVRNTIAKILEKIEKGLSWEKAIEEMKEYFEISDKKICEYGERIIENNSIIYTHCHSSTIEKTLKFAKKLGKNFTVYVTETRPLFQGRITAENLAKAGIKVVLGVDSNAFNFLKKADMFLFGADAITSEGDIINKIGTAMFAEIAQKLNVPCYCLSLSIKYDPITRYGYQEEIEQRPAKEIWNKKIKNLKIVNPAFEIVKAKNINAIISEYGILAPTAFVEIANKEFDIKKLTFLKNGLWRI